MKILLLGAEGMLGREILFQLVNKGSEVIGTCRGSRYVDRIDQQKFRLAPNFDAGSSAKVIELLDEVSPDVVINCIGVVKQHGDAFDDQHYFFLNGSLPRIIQAWCNLNKSRLVHFSTDCVFTGKDGQYGLRDVPDAFDTYGLSKAIGEVSEGNSLTIRTSIIGIERESRRGLLSWFLSNPDGSLIDGYVNVIYSGLTTSYLAQLVVAHYLDDTHTGLIQVGGPKISKYNLLMLANVIFDRKIHVRRCTKYISDKSFDSDSAFKKIGISQPDWCELLQHLKAKSIDRAIFGGKSGKF